MKQLPNGCHRSNLTVTPANWRSRKASIKKHWRISYRFYNSDGQSKQISIRGMNQFHTYDERRFSTEQLVANEIDMLDNLWYNPIVKALVPPEPTNPNDITQHTNLSDALDKGIQLLTCSRGMLPSIKSAVKFMQLHCRKLSLDRLPVSTVKPGHLLKILNSTEKDRKLTAVNYNHYRSYLMMIFTQIFLAGAVDLNPVDGIPRRTMTKTIKRTLDGKERKQVNEYLQRKDYEFWRYMQIFFHSGSRSTELFSVKSKDVNLVTQQYKCLIKKGRHPVEKMKTIKDVALPLWKELLSESTSKEDFLFARKLKPGRIQPDVNVITRRWNKHVKKHLKIDVDFYSLKHLNSTEVVDRLGSQAAADLNAHTSTAMVVNIYDVKRDDRHHEQLKKVDNPF